jgi:hypothetical protein
MRDYGMRDITIGMDVITAMDANGVWWNGVMGDNLRAWLESWFLGQDVGPVEGVVTFTVEPE